MHALPLLISFARVHLHEYNDDLARNCRGAVTTLRHEEATAFSFFGPLRKVACQRRFRDSIIFSRKVK